MSGFGKPGGGGGGFGTPFQLPNADALFGSLQANIAKEQQRAGFTSTTTPAAAPATTAGPTNNGFSGNNTNKPFVPPSTSTFRGGATSGGNGDDSDDEHDTSAPTRFSSDVKLPGNPATAQPTQGFAFGGQSSLPQFNQQQQQQQSGGIFAVAKEKLDEATFESAFNTLGLEDKKQILDTQVNSLLALPNKDASIRDDDNWLKALDDITAEVDKVEQQIAEQEEIEINNAITLLSEAVNSGAVISLPGQSAESKALSDHVQQLYKEMSSNTNQKMKLQNKPNKQQSAKNKANSRWDKLDALSSGTGGAQQNNNNNKNNNRNKNPLEFSFLDDDSFQPYKKQSQQSKKKDRKKLGW